LRPGCLLWLTSRPGFACRRALDVPPFLPYPLRTLRIPPFDWRAMSLWLFLPFAWLRGDLAPHQPRLLLARIMAAPVVIPSIRRRGAAGFDRTTVRPRFIDLLRTAVTMDRRVRHRGDKPAHRRSHGLPEAGARRVVHRVHPAGRPLTIPIPCRDAVSTPETVRGVGLP